MSARFSSWTVGLSFTLGASISLAVSFLALRFREPTPGTGTSTANTQQADRSKSRSKFKCSPESPTKETIILGTDGKPLNTEDDGDFRKAMVLLNETAMGEFNDRLQKTVPWADLGTLFARWYRLYGSSYHKLVQTRNLKSQDCRGSSTSKDSKLENDLLSVRQGQAVNTLRPLAPEVTALLQQSFEQEVEQGDYDICSALSGALRRGKLIWSHFARAVVQLDTSIVVKLGHNLSLTSGDMTAHIRRHSTDIPVPQPLGVISVGDMTYEFMSLIEGRPLDKLWPELSNAEKCSVRDQLDIILTQLRLLPLPSEYFGGGNPPHCVDCRMWKRRSPERMETEAQFNDFLFSDNRRAGMEPYAEFVKSMFRENHRIVLTHGDLHPRNILAVVDAERGEGIRITGLIDWEYSGAYPEYWEFVKSLNTIRPIRFGDWPFFLPVKGMGEYYERYAIDCLVEHCVT
ncbi:hypothetical protein AJ79_02198 [Helicocarpus griseus UAMH5409]|uniref:Aminoglycoside phosphotransferase domain-containing protein n=1 Tax=Helicocarpus griseus UAMH5409 TaxID=1447875 RepID=A0A2B7Y578_9EURO|nr:hypothetical protein AJ79_02198 [Helicocarpus griseus UAMH5409]